MFLLVCSMQYLTCYLKECLSKTSSNFVTIYTNDKTYPLRGASLNLTKRPMKKALQITGKILYTILALSPIFALGYMLGMKL